MSSFDQQYFKPGWQIARVTHFETRAPTVEGQVYRVRIINLRAKELYILYRVPAGFKPAQLLSDLAELSKPPKPWMKFKLVEKSGMYMIEGITHANETQTELDAAAREQTSLAN